MQGKWIIVDRDEVINHDSDNYIRSAGEWEPIDGSIKALANLSKEGYRIAVATNQSGLARGYFELEELEAMHDKLANLVEEEGGHIEGVFYCPHHPDDGCDCRKPKPGLLNAIEREFSVSLEKGYFVGDSLKDMQVAISKKMQPILVETGKGIKTKNELGADSCYEHVKIFLTLEEFADDLLGLG